VVRAFAVVGFLVVAQPASAATILVNGSGQLIGATGVIVAGASFNVSFTDGTCVAAYDGATRSAISSSLLKPKRLSRHKHCSVRCSWTAQAGSLTRCPV